MSDALDQGRSEGKRTTPSPAVPTATREATGRPAVVTPTTRVNVAFPFAHLRVQEPSGELAELVAVVSDLAAAVERLDPGASTSDIRRRAEALVSRLR